MEALVNTLPSSSQFACQILAEKLGMFVKDGKYGVKA